MEDTETNDIIRADPMAKIQTGIISKIRKNQNVEELRSLLIFAHYIFMFI
jgi:hypothetical protein